MISGKNAAKSQQLEGMRQKFVQKLPKIATIKWGDLDPWSEMDQSCKTAFLG